MQLMPRSSTLRTLGDLAEEQWGLFTRRQAERTGMAWSTLARMVADGAAERVAHGVYRLPGVPQTDNLDLRAAWLQLDPATPAWERGPETGVVSHRSAAALYGFGHLAAGIHEFTLPVRRQSRRSDVRMHRGDIHDDEWIALRGLPVTRPARIVVDLLIDREDSAAIGHVVADALREVRDYPGRIAEAIAPFAARHGLPRGDGVAMLEWLLGQTGDPDRVGWLEDARVSLADKDGHIPSRSGGRP